MAREDLGALFARLTRRMADAERPVLAAQHLSMWQYIVLSELARRPAQTQLALAQAIGYDKTRLIALLDDLQAAGLITRQPDPADRRARPVRLTEQGRVRHQAARTGIRAVENRMLGRLSADQRHTLLDALTALADDSDPAT